jgi:hypothetical protein
VVWQGDTNASTKLAAFFFRQQASRNVCFNPENYNKIPNVFGVSHRTEILRELLNGAK